VRDSIKFKKYGTNNLLNPNENAIERISQIEMGIKNQIRKCFNENPIPRKNAKNPSLKAVIIQKKFYVNLAHHKILH
jgi:hypothetical protein